MTATDIKDKADSIASALGFTPTTILGMYKKNYTYIHIYVEQIIVIFPEDEPHMFSITVSCNEKSVRMGFFASIEEIVEKIQEQVL